MMATTPDGGRADDSDADGQQSEVERLLSERVAGQDPLTSRERRVLQLRFGLDDGRTRTFEEVGREFNVTSELIRQIEEKALRKLRQGGSIAHPCPWQPPIGTTDEVCSEGHPMVIRFQRNGRFLACSLFPEHKELRPIAGAGPSVPA